MEQSVTFRIADVEIAVRAPGDLLRMVNEAYRRFPEGGSRGEPHTAVRVEEHDGMFDITIAGKPYESLPTGAGRGIIGLYISNAIITAVAQHSRFLIVHAAVLERDGEGMCIAGRGMSGKTLLATHLVSRRWRILSDEYAFIEPVSGQIVPFQKLLYVRSSSLPFIPRALRKSIECSPWYSLGDLPGIAFSGVDPASSYPEDVWSNGARLTTLLTLARDGGSARVEPSEPWALVPELNSLVWQPPDLLEGLSRLATALRGVQVGRLQAGTPLETADAVERFVNERQALALSA